MALRLEALEALRGMPVVLETHGGMGKVFHACYSRLKFGAVFEEDAVKAEVLADQRPTWAVYEADCEKAIAAGACSHRRFDWLDVDPYGMPFKVIEGFLTSKRELPPVLNFVVNDGGRQKCSLGGGWDVSAFADLVARFGNHNMYRDYLQVAKEKIRQLAGVAGYELSRWKGYHCGSKGDMTHYWAVLTR